MNDELERIWKDAIVVLIDVLSLSLPGKPEENHEETQLR
jgi:hypothetical protein